MRFKTIELFQVSLNTLIFHIFYWVKTFFLIFIEKKIKRWLLSKERLIQGLSFNYFNSYIIILTNVCIYFSSQLS